MPNPVYFKIKGFEVGASQKGTLQFLNGSAWVDLGNWVANVNGTIFIDSQRNSIEIPWRVQLFDVDGETPLLDINNEPLYDGTFYPGGTWSFRLIDEAGTPISQVVGYTFPGELLPLLDIGGEGLLDIDGAPLLDL